MTKGLPLSQGCYTVCIAKHRYRLVEVVRPIGNSRAFGKINLVELRPQRLPASARAWPTTLRPGGVRRGWGPAKLGQPRLGGLSPSWWISPAIRASLRLGRH